MKKNEKITSRDVDFAKWYTDVVSEHIWLVILMLKDVW